MEGAVRGGARLLAQVPDPVCRPDCTPGAADAVRMTLQQIIESTGLPRDAVKVELQSEPAEGTVVMEATIAFDVSFPGPVPFKRWMLKARHQEVRIGE